MTWMTATWSHTPIRKALLLCFAILQGNVLVKCQHETYIMFFWTLCSFNCLNGKIYNCEIPIFKILRILNILITKQFNSWILVTFFLAGITSGKILKFNWTRLVTTEPWPTTTLTVACIFCSLASVLIWTWIVPQTTAEECLQKCSSR